MQHYVVFATGRKRGGGTFDVRTVVQARSPEQARDLVEREYDFEDALTLNFEIFLDEDQK